MLHQSNQDRQPDADTRIDISMTFQRDYIAAARNELSISFPLVPHICILGVVIISLDNGYCLLVVKPLSQPIMVVHQSPHQEWSPVFFDKTALKIIICN